MLHRNRSPTCMDRLPVELIHHIARHLPERDRGALRLSCSLLAQVLPFEKWFDLESAVLRSKNPEFWEYMLPRLPAVSVPARALDENVPFVFSAILNRVDDVAVKLCRVHISRRPDILMKEALMRTALESCCFPVITTIGPMIDFYCCFGEIMACLKNAAKRNDLECVRAICTICPKERMLCNIWNIRDIASNVSLARCVKETYNLAVDDIWYNYQPIPPQQWVLLRVFGWEFLKRRIWVWMQFNSKYLGYIQKLGLMGSILVLTLVVLTQ